MATLFRIYLLGPVQVEQEGARLKDCGSRKSLALLGYLIRQGQPVSRTFLADMFWRDKTETRGRRNLSHELSLLSSCLPGCLEADHDSIQFKPTAAYWVDTIALADLIKSASSATSPDTEFQPEKLAEAVALYRGDFMAGHYVQDSPEFETWLVREREFWQQQVTESLDRLVRFHFTRRQDEQTQLYIRHWLVLEPWREEAHQYLMRLLALSGQRGAALAQYQRCYQILAEELGVEPMPETVALYEQIRAGELGKSKGGGSVVSEVEELQPEKRTPASLIPRLSTFDWGEAPDVTTFYGREAELAELTQWLDPDRCRLVAVLGMGGIGKTALSAKAAKALAEQFDFIFWRSLLNAPPLVDILRECLPFLSAQNLPEPPQSLNEGLGLLFDLLRRQRCLLVLDNVESILQSGHAGRYRPGYEAYGQLIQRMGETEHQSCLLLTSRERPYGMDRLEEDTSLVRSLRLAGLAADAGHEILQARGLTSIASAASTLVQRYSGHPLALKLISRTIMELFDGDVATFLAEETPIFDDIRDVLDQQFARLSTLERELVVWLAIEREAISPQALQDNLVYPESRGTLLEALRALQRRSFLEKIGQGFTLQNVVMEYTTDYLIEQVCQELATPGNSGGLRKTRQNPEFRSSPAGETTSAEAALMRLHLNRYALLKAQSKEYVRQSQTRLILQPIARRLATQVGATELPTKLKRLLAYLQAEVPAAPGYVAGNILNLLIHLGVDLRGYDFSRLNVWQAYLRGVRLPQVNFTQADLTRSAFTDAFSFMRAIAYSPDGQLLAMATESGDVRLWHIAAGQLYGVCQGHTGRVSCVAFSADGQTLASGSLDKTVRLWDVQSCQVRHILMGHTDNVRTLAFSPATLESLGEQTLVSGSHDQTLRLWDTHTGRLRQTLTGHSGWITSLAFSPDGQLLASASFDRTVRLWDVSNAASLSAGQASHILTEHTDAVAAVTFSPDGQTLASGGADQTIYLWDISTYQISQALTGHTNWIWSLVFSADGQTLVSGSADQTIRLWDAQTGQLQQLLSGHSDAVLSVAFSPDGHTLASASFDQTIRLWDAHRGQQGQILQGYSQMMSAVAFQPAALENNLDSQIVAGGSYDGLISLWNSHTGHLSHTLSGHTAGIMALAFTPNGRILASGSVDQTVRLWDAQTGLLLQTLWGHSQDVGAVAFSPDGQTLASSSDDGTARLWDVAGGYTRHVLHGHIDWVMSVAFSPDGFTLASGSNDQTVRLWNVHTGESLSILPGHSDRIHSLVFSPNGQTLASSSNDRTIRLWDVQSGQTNYILSTPEFAQSIAFSPDGQTLAGGNFDHTVHLWTVNGYAAQRRAVLSGHLQQVMSVAFSADGQTLASSSADETVKVWDVATGQCLKTLQGERPYAGMNISGATGLTEAQKAGLKALGAVNQ